MSFSDYALSLKAREAFENIAKDVVNKLRPPTRYGYVTALQGPNACRVQFIGEPLDVPVNLGSIKPSRVGVLVRVGGRNGDHYVEDVIGDVVLMGTVVSINVIARTCLVSLPGVGSPVEVPMGKVGPSRTGLQVRLSGGPGAYYIEDVYGDVPFRKFYELTLLGGRGQWDPDYWHTPSYAKTTAGIVMLSGLVIFPSGGSSHLFTLPVGYRPDSRMMYGVANGGAIATSGVRIDILSNGEVHWEGGNASPTYISLDGINFPAVGAVQWTPITAWTNGYGPHGDTSFGVPSYGVDSLGRCWMRGLVAKTTGPGAQTGDVKMFNLPYGYSPSLYLHMNTISSASNQYGCVGIAYDAPTGLCKADDKRNNHNGHISLASMFWCSGGAFPANDPRRRILKGRNGWTAYNVGSFPRQQTITHSDGIVMCEGLVGSGTINAKAFQFARGYEPDAVPTVTTLSGQMMYRTVGADAPAQIVLVEENGVNVSYTVSHGSNAWHSLNGVNYLLVEPDRLLPGMP